MPNAQAYKFVMALVKGVMPGVMIIFVLAMLVLAFKFLVLPKLKGKVGEGIINFLARRHLDPAVYLLIPDIMPGVCSLGSRAPSSSVLYADISVLGCID